jgi:hypothetical protein
MFRNADTSKWHEDAWGDDESAPPEITSPVDEQDAQIIDKLVLGIKSERLKLALLIEYAAAPKSFKFRRFGYTESVDEAVRLMDDLLHGMTKKQVVFRMLQENRHSETHIAEIAGCSQPYVSQLRRA